VYSCCCLSSSEPIDLSVWCGVTDSCDFTSLRILTRGRRPGRYE
jgi:hypothetical protein